MDVFQENKQFIIAFLYIIIILSLQKMIVNQQLLKIFGNESIIYFLNKR